MKDCFKSILAFLLALFMAVEPAAAAVGVGYSGVKRNMSPSVLYNDQALAPAALTAEHVDLQHPTPAVELRVGAAAELGVAPSGEGSGLNAGTEGAYLYRELGPDAVLDPFDRANYHWDGRYWRSNHFPRLILGTWRDLERNYRASDREERERMVNHVAIRLKAGFTIYAVDDDKWAVAYIKEAQARGEVAEKDNDFVMADQHYDYEGNPVAPTKVRGLRGWFEFVRDRLNHKNWINALADDRVIRRHWRVYNAGERYEMQTQDKLAIGQPDNPDGIYVNEGGPVRGYANVTRSGFHKYEQLPDRPRNRRVIFKADTDASENPEEITDFLKHLKSRDGVTPSVAIVAYTVDYADRTQIYGSFDATRKLARDWPGVFTDSNAGSTPPAATNPGALEIHSPSDAARRSEAGKVGGTLSFHNRPAFPVRLQMNPPQGSQTLARQGRKIKLQVVTPFPNSVAELWSNRSRRWPNDAGENAAETEPGSGVYERQVPVDRDFEYTFRVWNRAENKWEFATEKPEDNGHIIIDEGTSIHPRNDVLYAASKPLPPIETKPLPGRSTILFGAMENRFKKKGGEGDYIRDFPAHLARRGHDVYVVSYSYADTPAQLARAGLQAELLGSLDIPMGATSIRMEVDRVRISERLTYFLLRDPVKILAQDIYQDPDGLRGLVEAVVLPRAICLLPILMKMRVDHIHANDWQAALSLYYAQHVYSEALRGVGRAYTAHNMAYKGLFPLRDISVSGKDPVFHLLQREGVLPLKEHHRSGAASSHLIHTSWIIGMPDYVIGDTERGLEFFGKIALAKGMRSAHVMTAVSRGNLRELVLPVEQGGTAYGFEGVVQSMQAAGRTAAVPNGIDDRPETNPDLLTDGFTPYSASDPDLFHKRAQNLKALQRYLATFPAPGRAGPKDKVVLYGALVPWGEDDFVLGSIGRIAEQKGIDVVLKALPEILAIRGPKNQKIRFVGLGSAEEADPDGMAIERALKQMAMQHKFREQLLFAIGFSATLANRIYGSETWFSMISIQEPCGLSNIIANLHGAPVIAPRTGGLIDFFDDWHGSGIPIHKFLPQEKDRAAHEVVEAVRQAAFEFWTDKPAYEKRVRQGMAFNASWDSRVELYEQEVYGRASAIAQAEASGLSLTHKRNSHISGASRAVGWLFGTNNPVAIGKIEGFWQSFAGAWALHAAHAQGLANVSDLLQAALPVFLGVALALLLAHYITGVVVSEHEEAKRWNPILSFRAAGTALIGFVGWPLMALGVVVGGPVGLVMILAGFAAGPVLHGWANQSDPLRASQAYLVAAA